MKKKLSELNLQKTTISELNGGICKCDIIIPGTGVHAVNNDSLGSYICESVLWCDPVETACCYSRHN